MPTDTNGVYSLPPAYLAVGGTTIQTSQHNPIFEDVASALTQRLMASGANAMTGPLKAAAGAVSAPGVTFASDQQTGLYKTTNGFGIAVGGALVAEFAAGGLPSQGFYKTAGGLAVVIGGALVAEFTAGGLTKGGKRVGELFDYVGTAAPALCVLPVGQTLSRSTYADLWTLAQSEIALGNVFFNNGDGSTTFGIGDLRGRVTAAKDDMGGSAANRMTSTYFGTDGKVIGNVGGAESKTLVTGNLPAYTPAGTISNGAITINNQSLLRNRTADNNTDPTGGTLQSSMSSTAPSLTASQGTTTFSGTAQGGTSTAFSLVQHTMITQKVLFAGA